MVLITEQLIRKRAEHNECLISTLEEVSLHQQDIERIENIENWCRELKILYLQSNLIPKVENVGKLKKLEYLNLALNNIEKIENLSGCESLRKLDFTVNFIGELTSIKSLQENFNLTDLYLVGNPCANYDHYRDYVIATLPQLKHLDGVDIEKSERILAIQKLPEIEPIILQQEKEQLRRRISEKNKTEAKEVNKNKPGFDGRWYTDINNTNDLSESVKRENDKNQEITEEEKEKEFWEEKVPFTPESRIAVHQHLQEKRNKEDKSNKEKPKQNRRLVADDGRILNVNEPKIDFTLTEDENANSLLLDIALYRYLDTSLCDVDVQPTFVKVVIKGKIFQLVLNEEVKPDSSTAQRSKTTGHLLITMPRAHGIINKPQSITSQTEKNKAPDFKQSNKIVDKVQNLEVDPKCYHGVDISDIGTKKLVSKQPTDRTVNRIVQEKKCSDSFIDDPDVPPLC